MITCVHVLIGSRVHSTRIYTYTTRHTDHTQYANVQTESKFAVRPVQVVFHSDGMYVLQVLLTTVMTGTWKDSERCSNITNLFDTQLANLGYVLCPSIVNYSTMFGDHVQFISKNLRVWNVPHTQTDSTQRALWHKPVHTNQKPGAPTYNMCGTCRLLYHGLRVIHKGVAASPTHKEKQTEPSSNMPIKYLYPSSQVARLQKSTNECRCLRRALFKAEMQWIWC